MPSMGAKMGAVMRVRHPELVLAAAVLICSPMLPGLFSGSLSVTTALIRFLIALIGCWIAGSVITGIFHAYARAQEEESTGSLMEDTALMEGAGPTPAERSGRPYTRAENPDSNTGSP